MKLSIVLLLSLLAFQAKSAEVVHSVSRGVASVQVDEQRIVDLMNQHFRTSAIGPNTNLENYMFAEWQAVDFVVRAFQQQRWAYPGSLGAIREGFAYAGCLSPDGLNSRPIQTPLCIAKAFAYAKTRYGLRSR
jgi:hypothetical protein